MKRAVVEVGFEVRPVVGSLKGKVGVVLSYRLDSDDGLCYIARWDDGIYEVAHWELEEFENETR